MRKRILNIRPVSRAHTRFCGQVEVTSSDRLWPAMASPRTDVRPFQVVFAKSMFCTVTVSARDDREAEQLAWQQLEAGWDRVAWRDDGGIDRVSPYVIRDVEEDRDSLPPLRDL